MRAKIEFFTFQVFHTEIMTLSMVSREIEVKIEKAQFSPLVLAFWGMKWVPSR